MGVSLLLQYLAPSVESELGGVNELRLTAGWRAGDKHSGFAPQNAELHPYGHSLNQLKFLSSVYPGKYREPLPFRERPGSG